MDPDELLVALRDCAQDLINGTDEYTFAETANTMADQFDALDTWLTNGGFLPGSWQSQERNVHERIDAIERERELERARKHTYRPYDTSGQERA